MRKGEQTRAHDVLVAAPLFRGLPSRRLRQVLNASRLERYTAGDVIVHQGSPGDAFYVVIRGGVVVQTSHVPGEFARVATLGVGDYFGEMALLTGRPRVAEVVADGETEVLAVPGAVFEGQLLSDPWFKARLVEQSQERETDLLRQRVALVLQGVPIFAALRWEELARVAASAGISALERGTVICRPGDEGGSLFVVLSGEVEVRVLTRSGETVVTSLTEGSSFGEMSLLSGEPVSATLEVVLDCTLLTLDKAHFEALLDHAPFARNMSQILSERLRDQTAASGRLAADVGGAVIVVTSAAPGQGKTALAVNLAVSLARQAGTVALVDLDPERGATACLGVDPSTWDGASGDEQFAPREVGEGLAVLPLTLGGRAARLQLARAMGALKQRYRHVVVDTTDRAAERAHDAAALADAVVYLTDGTAPSADLTGQADLLLVYAAGTPAAAAPPSGAAHVFRLPANLQPGRRAAADCEVFVRTQPRSSLSRAVARIARYLTRQQVGLVLAGGAAWGPSQAGVLVGLEERGADVDLIAAAGIGSLLGAAYAAGLPVQMIQRLALEFHDPIKDLLAPRGRRRAEIGRGRRLRHLLRTYFGGLDFEDLYVPLGLTAADADTGVEVVLRSGSLVDALEATIGLPALATRRLGEAGRLLVDGSVVRPVPLQVAREMGADVTVAVAGGPRPSAAALGRRRRVPLGRRQAPLRMAMLALRLAAHRLAIVSAERSDLVIAVPTAGATSDARGSVLFDLGRAAAVEAAPRIAALQAERLRPPLDR
jgi:CRP-like cAMP-binding protein/predicted acylesterase/phospholipase RssA